MRRLKVLVYLGLLAAAMLGACDRGGDFTGPEASLDGLPVTLSNGPAMTAVMDFGSKIVGSPYPPPSGHDDSFHAKDKVRPRTVVVAAGGTVVFNVGPVHQVAVYDDGVEPTDIDLANAGFIIDDPTERIGLGPPVSFTEGHQYAFTFNEPGEYLVICTVTPHFVDAKMYGWVTVK